jgi:hypothetical protein
MSSEKGDKYEDVAQYLLNQFADHFGLERVEEKQKIVGLISKRKIEIDAKGIKIGGSGFVIVECKAWGRKVEAEKLEALAFRIDDAGADSGIIVSTMELQEGPKKIADNIGVVHVKLDENSTKYNYVISFLNKFMVASTLNLFVGGSAPASQTLDSPPSGSSGE